MAEADLGDLARAQSTGQEVAQTVRLGLLGPDLPFGDQLFDVGVIDGALDQFGLLEAVQAAVAHMGPMRRIAVQDQGNHGAVRLLLRGQRRELDDGMRLVHDLGE
jgi:hypothetical protein